jgi:hypothetical protein
MAEAAIEDLGRARASVRMAAQWLTLLRFRAHAGAPAFSPSLSLYHDMLDPKAGDHVRASACRKMLELVQGQLPLEHRAGQEAYALQRPVDPYGLHWRTTERGAALSAIVLLLEAAIDGPHRAGSKKGT